MKILFLLNIGFDRVGPSVHLLQDVIRKSLEEGHHTDVILKDTGGESEKIPSDFLNNNLFNYTLVKSISKGKKGFVARYFEEISYALKCKKIHQKNKYDVIFLQSCNSALFYMCGIKNKCPIVFNVQDVFPYNLMFSEQLPLKKITFPFFRKLQNIAYKKAAKIITISDDMKKTLINDGIDAEKIEVIYNWSYSDEDISLEKIDESCIFPLNKDDSKLNVVYAGNIGKMQNVEIVAKSAVLTKDNHNIHYYIIGDGANKARIEQMTEGLNNVTILPMQPSKFAESIYAQADVNIIPLSKGGVFTALPSKTATCLRVGKPIVFCIDKNSEFYSLMQNEENIYLCDCDDGNGLADILKNICLEMKNSYVRSEKVCNLITVENVKKYVEILEISNK